MPAIRRATGRDRSSSWAGSDGTSPRSTLTTGLSTANGDKFATGETERDTWIILLLGIILIAVVATSGHRSPEASPVAIPARSSAMPAPQHEIGAQQMTTMPDGNTVPTTFRGYLSDVSQLPHHGAQPGDMWGVSHNLWVLTTPANSYKVGWVDPPRRA